MKIVVRLHAQLRKHLPAEAGGVTQVDLPEDATVADVLAGLGIPAKHAGMFVSRDEHLQPTSVLRDGQELNVFPPLAGGAGP